MAIAVEYSNKDINKIVIENCLKMLERRKVILSHEDIIKKLGDDIYTKSIIEVVSVDNIMYNIYIVNSKLSSIIYGSQLDNYLSSDINIHKIIIVKEFTKKVVKQIITDYKNSEIFFESEMMEDIINKDIVPIHQLLDADEKNELLSKFSENELAKILNTDIISRYYDAKIGDIFRIIRPSNTAGNNIFYRRVINGSWDILFT